MKKKLKIILSSLIVFPIVISTPIVLNSCSNTTNTNNTPNNSLPPTDNNSPPNTDNNPNNSVLNSAGGVLPNGLNVDKYLEIVKQLNLTKSTKLSTIDINQLNSLLNKTYPKLKLGFLPNSNEKTGTLVLSLIGEYNNYPIADEIKITNFDSFSNFSSNTFQLSNFKINDSIWFKNHQPIDSKQNLVFSQDQRVLKNLIGSNTNILFNDSKYSIKYYDALNDFEVTNLMFSKDSKANTKFKLNFSLVTKYKQFDFNTQSWIEIPDQLTFNLNAIYSANLPTKIDLKRYILDSVTIVDKNINFQFASYYLGKFRFNKQLKPGDSDLMQFNRILNFDEVFNQFQQTYFDNEQIYLIPDWTNDNGVEIDLNTNTLSFTMILKDDTKPNDNSISRVFKTNHFQNQIDYINNLKNRPNKRNIISLLDSEQSTFKRLFKQLFKIQITEVQNTQVSTNVTVSNNPLLNKQYNIFQWVNTSADDNTNKNTPFLDFYKKNISNLDLFSKSLNTPEFLDLDFSLVSEPTIDLSSGLTLLNSSKKNELFLIDGLYISFDNSVNVTIEHRYGKTISIIVPAKINLIISGMQETIVLESKMILNSANW